MKRNYFGTALTLLAMILIGGCVAANAQVQTAQAQFRNALDFDGDGKADVTVTRYTSITQPISWYMRSSSNGVMRSAQFGSANNGFDGGTGTYDFPAAGDYDGDGKADVAVVRLSGGTQPVPAMWYILQSGSNTVRSLAFGNGSRAAADSLRQGDYDGDGKTDVAVARYENNTYKYYIYQSSNSQITARTMPIPASSNDCFLLHSLDIDGDRKQDLGLACGINNGANMQWHIQRSSDGVTERLNWGTFNDYPVAADYDGDGKTDYAVIRSVLNGNNYNYYWYIRRSSDGVLRSELFGYDDLSGLSDVWAPADYDGDGKVDIAVHRYTGNSNSPGVRYIMRSASGNSVQAIQWGLGNDSPLTLQPGSLPSL